MTAFVDASTITVVKDGGFFGHPQSDMGNVGLISLDSHRKAMINKIFPNFAAAVSDVPDGASVMIGGFARAGVPTNLVAALRDHGVRNLTLICNALSLQVAANLQVAPNSLYDVGRILVNAHLVRRAIVCVGFAIGTGASATDMEEQIASGDLEVELVPQGTLVERIRAGGAGIGAFYTPVGVGSRAEEGKEMRVIDGVACLLEKPLRADYALVKAFRADTLGNLVYRRAARNYNRVMAPAARITIAEVEDVVAPVELDPESVGTPCVYVDRLVQVQEGIDV